MPALYTMESVDRKLRALGKSKVLVVGDVMLDQYWLGDVKRISPEAPVPVVAVSETDERVGGAGNVARNITALGGFCTLLSIIGDDEQGRSVERIADTNSINCVLVVDKTIKTTIKLRVLSRNQQLLRADFENTPDQDALNKIHSQFKNLVELHDVVVMSDYGKGCLNEIQSLIKIAAQCGKPVLVDPKGADFSRYRGAKLVTPNLSEFESVAGNVKDDRDLEEKACAILTREGIEQVLVTLSDKGMILFGENQPPVHIQARSREVYDVSGAGDTVIAVLAMAVAADLSNADAMSLANSAAGIVISKLGTATTSPDELRAAILEDYQE